MIFQSLALLIASISTSGGASGNQINVSSPTIDIPNYSVYYELSTNDLDDFNTQFVFTYSKNEDNNTYRNYLNVVYHVANNELSFNKVGADNNWYYRFVVTSQGGVSLDSGLIYNYLYYDNYSYSFSPLSSQDNYTICVYNYFMDADFYTKMFITPYQEGNTYFSGYTDGYNQGQTDGYNQGVLDGHELGYTEGFNEGKPIGYQEGYATAMTTHDFTFTNLFASLGDTPILYLRSMFNFELWGMNVLAVFLSLFTLLIVIKVIKKVF